MPWDRVGSCFLVDFFTRLHCIPIMPGALYRLESCHFQRTMSFHVSVTQIIEIHYFCCCYFFGAYNWDPNVKASVCVRRKVPPEKATVVSSLFPWDLGQGSHLQLCQAYYFFSYQRWSKMNWTEGRLRRHASTKSRNSDLLKQKKAFAKARINKALQSTPRDQHATPFFRVDIPGQSPTKIACHSTSPQVPTASKKSPPAKNLQNSPSKISEKRRGRQDIDREVKRLRLLEKQDWVGLDLQKPINLARPVPQAIKQSKSSSSRCYRDLSRVVPPRDVLYGRPKHHKATHHHHKPSPIRNLAAGNAARVAAARAALTKSEHSPRCGTPGSNNADHLRHTDSPLLYHPQPIRPEAPRALNSFSLTVDDRSNVSRSVETETDRRSDNLLSLSDNLPDTRILVDFLDISSVPGVEKSNLRRSLSEARDAGSDSLYPEPSEGSSDYGEENRTWLEALEKMANQPKAALEVIGTAKEAQKASRFFHPGVRNEMGSIVSERKEGSSSPFWTDIPRCKASEHLQLSKVFPETATSHSYHRRLENGLRVAGPVWPSLLPLMSGALQGGREKGSPKTSASRQEKFERECGTLSSDQGLLPTAPLTLEKKNAAKGAAESVTNGLRGGLDENWFGSSSRKPSSQVPEITRKNTGEMRYEGRLKRVLSHESQRRLEVEFGLTSPAQLPAPKDKPPENVPGNTPRKGFLCKPPTSLEAEFGLTSHTPTPPAVEKDAEDDETAWMSFVFGKDDSEDMNSTAFSEAKRDAARQIVPSVLSWGSDSHPVQSPLRTTQPVSETGATGGADTRASADDSAQSPLTYSVTSFNVHEAPVRIPDETTTFTDEFDELSYVTGRGSFSPLEASTETATSFGIPRSEADSTVAEIGSPRGSRPPPLRQSYWSRPKPFVGQNADVSRPFGVSSSALAEKGRGRSVGRRGGRGGRVKVGLAGGRVTGPDGRPIIRSITN